MSDLDLMLEVGGRRASGMANGKLWIGKNGLDGWWDSAETLYNEETSDDQDGAYDPSEVRLGPKRVNVYLLADASSPGWADLDVRPWATGLARLTDLGFRVYHAGRWQYLLDAKIRGKVEVKPNRSDMRLTDIRFTVWSWSPFKYGPMLSLPVPTTIPAGGGLAFPIAVPKGLSFGATGVTDAPGVFRITNPGTAEVYPIFTVRGPMASFTITSENNTIAYSAPIPAGSKLTLSPYAGGRALLDGADVSQNLTQAEWVPVNRESTRGYTLTAVNPGADSGLTVDFPEGAWS